MPKAICAPASRRLTCCARERFSMRLRRGPEREVDIIGAGSLIGMLVLLFLVFRSVRPLLLGLLSVGFGIVAAVVATVAVYGEIHLIALVFGASLIGEAIDYAIQYFAAHLGAGAGWEPMAGLRRIAPGLSVAPERAAGLWRADARAVSCAVPDRPVCAGRSFLRLADRVPVAAVSAATARRDPDEVGLPDPPRPPGGVAEDDPDRRDAGAPGQRLSQLAAYRVRVAGRSRTPSRPPTFEASTPAAAITGPAALSTT